MLWFRYYESLKWTAEIGVILMKFKQIERYLIKRLISEVVACCNCIFCVPYFVLFYSSLSTSQSVGMGTIVR